MSVLSTLKKGYIAIKTAANEYTKFLPRTASTLVTMNDGTTVENKINQINTNLTDSLSNTKILSRYMYYNTININIVTPEEQRRTSAILSLTYGTTEPMLAIVSLTEALSSINETSVYYLNKKEGVTISAKCEDMKGKYRIKVYNKSNMGVHVGCIVFNCDSIYYGEINT